MNVSRCSGLIQCQKFGPIFRNCNSLGLENRLTGGGFSSRLTKSFVSNCYDTKSQNKTELLSRPPSCFVGDYQRCPSLFRHHGKMRFSILGNVSLGNGNFGRGKKMKKMTPPCFDRKENLIEVCEHRLHLLVWEKEKHAIFLAMGKKNSFYPALMPRCVANVL